MTLAPLLNAEPVIQIHAVVAIAAFALELFQFSAPKGTLRHRTLGWIWVALLLIVSLSSFAIHKLRIWGPWSPIHLLSVFTPVMLVLGVVWARQHNVRAHKITMVSIFLGAVVIAGVFTLAPGRVMHAVVFGG